MQTRLYWQSAHVVMAFIVGWTIGSISLNAAERERPNILFILLDDAGYGDFGCFGGTMLPTPHIDQMCAEGLKLTQAYAGSTVCAPSRCVLLTGKHTGHARVRGNSPGMLQPDDVTIAEVLQQAGYRTACVGKWGVGALLPLDDPIRNGFDNAFGYVSMWHAHNFFPEFLIRNGHREKLRNVVGAKWKQTDGRGIAEKKVDYVPELLTREVLKLLQAYQLQPFFLYYALNVPHANNEATRAKTPERGMEVPSFGPYADKDWPGPEKGFAAIMRNIDRDVGRLLEKLKELGIEKKTLVILTSDNGPHQEGGHQMEFFDSNGPLRGMKRDLYEGGVRVPMIAWWPDRIDSGTESDHICAFQDVLPTLAEVAGVRVPESIDGISFLPTLLGQPERQREHEYLYWEFTEQGGKRGIRQGDWKLVQLKASSPSPSPPELYNLRQDLSETKDIAAEHPDMVERLTQLMDKAHVSSTAYPLFADERTAQGTPKRQRAK